MIRSKGNRHHIFRLELVRLFQHSSYQQCKLYIRFLTSSQQHLHKYPLGTFLENYHRQSLSFCSLFLLLHSSIQLGRLEDER